MWPVLWVLCPYPLLLPLQCNQGLKHQCLPASLPEGLLQPLEPTSFATVRQAAGAKEPAPIAPRSEQPKDHLSLSPQWNNRAWRLHCCQNLSSRTRPPLSTVVTCLITHYVLAVFSPYFTSLLPSKFSHLPRDVCTYLYPRVYENPNQDIM